MDICKHADTFVCNVLLCIILAFTTTCGSLSPGALCLSPDNRRVISRITEDMDIGASVAQLNISGSNSQIQLSLDSNKYGFLFDVTSRSVTVGKRLKLLWPDSGNQENAQLIIRCSPIASTSSTEQVLMFYITIWDINDNAPVFVDAPYVVNMSEWTTIGDPVISSISASDLDPSDIGYLSYSISQENPFASSFEFPVSTVGKIVLRQLINYDEVETVNLTIYVKDNSNNHTVLGRVQPQFTTNTTVTVYIQRERYYFYPTFTTFTFTGAIARDTARESVVNVTPSIATSISMANVAHPVNYGIIRDEMNDDAKHFKIDNTTGQLTTFLPIVASTPCLLAFQIKVFEIRQPWYFDTALVKVVIIDDTDIHSQCLALQQLHYNVTLAEDVPIGSVVVRVLLQELPCQPDNHVFSLVDDLSHGYFTVDTFTGEIRTAATLLHSAMLCHTIIVKVTDGILTNFSTVFLEVKRTQYYAHFTKKSFIFRVTSAAGVIGKIHVFTNDTREKIEYDLLMNPEIKPPELFAIDGDGWLSAVNTLVEDTYTMAVVAHDGDPVDAALIVVHVQDSSTPASLSDTFDGATLVAVAVAIVSGVLVLISLLLIIILFVKNRRISRENMFLRRHYDNTLAASGRFNSSIIRKRLSQNKESDTAYSDLRSKIASANSIPSKNGASDTDGHNACMPEARGTEVAPELPQHNAYQPDQFSMKSCSTTSQPSGVAEKCDYDESFDLDPSASGSTVTLMGQMPTTRCDDSLQSVNNMPSPGGSLVSFGTRQRSSDAPGITVYY